MLLPFVSMFRLPTFGRRLHLVATRLNSGRGVATNYKWQEEAFEIEVTVPVPKDTKAKHVVFEATSTSIALSIRLPHNGSMQTLLDPSRKLRGRVSLDGTYWVISDKEGDSVQREVTVTIEKLIKTPKSDFDVVEYDWKGVYSNDGEEVSERQYDTPETLDVREYAASLGVDIDNINMSMVDKTMFSSGFNMTQSSLDELTKAGLMKEVTRQADGTEYTVNDEGEPEKFLRLGETVGSDELERSTSKKPLPLIDTNSPWNSAVPVRVDKTTNQTYVQQTRNFTRAAFANDSAEIQMDESPVQPDAAADPIDLLTVKRLKEILKSQGLKVSGTKKELQDRLRSQVNALLQGRQTRSDK